MTKLAKDLREFIALLTSHGAEFVVVGGHAVAYHGYPRFTGDIDLFVRPSADNARSVLAALEDFGFGDVGIGLDDLTTPNRIIQLGVPPNRIDILTGISGPDFQAVWTGRVHDELDGLPVSYIGLTELLANKRASGRAKDLADLEALAPPDD